MTTMMTSLCLALVLCVAVVVGQEPDPNPVVQTTTGQVRGYTIPDRIGDGHSFLAFEGIPYAEPPLGELRFQPPVPALPWEGVLNATQWGSNCVQWSGDELIGSEDCLFLNIYTEELPPADVNELKAVIFYIHGGGFQTGSGNYGADFFIAQDVVVVTTNYRLGILGFFTTQDDVVQGNAGLKDLVVSLQWVQDNIATFGGDPERVAIMGESAGAAAVQYLTQSPLAAGLFSRAIAHSGSTLNRWTRQPDGAAQARLLASEFALESDTSAALVEFLQLVDAEDLYVAASRIPPPYLPFVWETFNPTVENEHEGAFISESSYDSVNLGNYHHVPLIIGTNSAEGVLLLGDNPDFERLDEEPGLLDPVALNLEVDSEDYDTVGQLIKAYFYDNETTANTANFVRHWTDENFRRGVRKTVELVKHDIPVFYYVFTYKGSTSGDYEGVTHAEELRYFWYSGQEESEPDRLTRLRVTTLWTNFAKIGQPTDGEENEVLQNIEWLSALSGDVDGNYLDIGDDLVPGLNFEDEQFEFWNLVFEAYGRPPYTIW